MRGRLHRHQLWDRLWRLCGGALPKRRRLPRRRKRLRLRLSGERIIDYSGSVTRFFGILFLKRTTWAPDKQAKNGFKIRARWATPSRHSLQPNLLLPFFGTSALYVLATTWPSPPAWHRSTAVQAASPYIAKLQVLQWRVVSKKPHYFAHVALINPWSECSSAFFSKAKLLMHSSKIFMYNR